jgi:hypothetical protein
MRVLSDMTLPSDFCETELTLDPPDATSDEAGVPLLDEDYLILEFSGMRAPRWLQFYNTKSYLDAQ